MIEPEDSFPSIRRNLMIMSCAMLFVSCYSNNITSISLLGNTIPMDGSVMRWLVLAVWTYTLARFYQSYKETHDDRWGTMRSQVNEHLKAKHLRLIAEEKVARMKPPRRVIEIKTNSHRTDGENEVYEVVCTLKDQSSMLSEDDRERIEIRAPGSLIRSFLSIATNEAITSSTYTTDRYFPFVMAAVVLAIFIAMPIVRFFNP